MAYIEKVFAIEAEPGAIWDALYGDLAAGQEGSFAVEAAHRPEELTLNVTMGGIPTRLTYRIAPKADHCEVSAIMETGGLRYGISQVLTFGHFRRNFEMVLVQGLANLKTSLEPEAEPELVEETEA